MWWPMWWSCDDSCKATRIGKVAQDASAGEMWPGDDIQSVQDLQHKAPFYNDLHGLLNCCLGTWRIRSATHLGVSRVCNWFEELWIMVQDKAGLKKLVKNPFSGGMYRTF
jgi:hypothetical protein